ncbi:hypothetical protein BOTU111921_11310 [Bordetella tumbae]|uniref:DUF3800 domain-containing protein n=1 Tax=Bordetella tumbae TaxID=1649139 RepID=UPI0039EFE1C3
MRVVYVDEAGTSDSEPHRIVVGVQVADSEMSARAENAIRAVVNKFVPADLGKDFIFHGKEIINGGKRVPRERWPLSDRLDFFKSFVSIPRSLGMPIHVGATKANALNGNFPEDKISASERDHMMAFAFMLQAANRIIKRMAGKGERILVVHESIPERQQFLSKVYQVARQVSVQLSPEQVQPLPLGYSHPDGLLFSADLFVDAPAFAQKKESPMLQLADACAYTFRRYLAGSNGGAELLMAMIGRDALHPNWCEPCASVTYYASNAV